jgi:hypothetical protein
MGFTAEKQGNHFPVRIYQSHRTPAIVERSHHSDTINHPGTIRSISQRICALNQPKNPKLKKSESLNSPQSANETLKLFP